MTRARVIRKAPGSGEPWRAPALGAAAPAPCVPAFMASGRDAGAAAQEHALGREQGYAEGHRAGLAAAQAETAARIAALDELTANLRAPLARVDDAVADELARLALAIARQVIRRELATDSEQVVAVVKEAMRALGDVRGTLRIALHPHDAAIVRAMFGTDGALSGVDVDEDPSLARGGCTLSTDVSFVDARVETLIARIAVELLGDARARPAARAGA